MKAGSRFFENRYTDSQVNSAEDHEPRSAETDKVSIQSGKWQGQRKFTKFDQRVAERAQKHAR